MLSKERQNIIHSLIKRNGAVTTSNLVKKFDVSLETIRRDLLFMEQSGLLTRVHGGAVAVGEMKPFYELDRRNLDNSDKKRELSLLATKFIDENDYICIDSGSTAIIFADILKEKFSKLTVITHSLDVFEILHNKFTVILCGGYFFEKEKSFFGSPTIDMINTIHAKKAFIFPSAVSLEFGIYDYQQDLLLIQKAMLKAADEIFVLADSSKFESKALLKLDDMCLEYTYITDSKLAQELKQLYLENNIKIIT